MLKQLFRIIIINLILFVCLSSYLYSENISVLAQISNQVIYLGDTATLEVNIKGSSTDDIKIQHPKIDGVSINYIGSQSRSSYSVVINGKQVSGSEDMSYSYTVKPIKKGDFRIPPIKVIVQGEEYSTNPVSFNVSEPPKDDNIIFQIKLSKDECYIMESIDVQYKLLYSKVENNNRNQLSVPLIHDETLKKEYSAEVIDEHNAREKYKGIMYNVANFSIRITPNKVGTYTIPAASYKAYVKTGEYYVTQDFWGYQTKKEKLREAYASTGSKILIVKDLPEEGRPAGYSGAVGKYGLNITTNDSLVKMMDPIIIQIQIKGKGNLEELRCPILPEIKELSKNFKISFNPNSTGKIDNNKIVFEQSIHPKSTDIKEIPPIPFSYFDTEEEKYTTVYSKAIPIKVLPNEKVDSSMVIGNDIDSKVEKTAIEEGDKALKANHHLLNALDSERIYLGYLLILLIFPVGYFITSTIINRHRKLHSDYTLIRAKEAKGKAKEKLGLARQNIENKEFFEYLSKGLGSYLSDKLNLGTGEFTINDANNLKQNKKIDSEIIKDIIYVIEECDNARFAGLSNDNSDLKNDILAKSETIINKMEKSL